VTDHHAYDDDLRGVVERLCRFDTTGGNERPAQEYLRDRLTAWGFDTYTWEADPERLADHDSFPDDPGAIDTEDRPSVAGVVELGDPDAGPTVVLNGHVDVVPADAELWATDPFEPTWNRHPAPESKGNRGPDNREGDDDTLTARGAVDMKSGLAACVFAARRVADEGMGLNGRVVVESVVEEEAGGIGAAAAALDNPYPFERDYALVAEPTELRPVVATEGCLMKRLRLTGRSAHAARRWRGESVLPHFERVRSAFEELEAERADRVDHPLYDRFDNPWPVTTGKVSAGSWASTVPATLEAECRFGVAPGETVAEVEAEYEAALDRVTEESEWLSAHPPEFERFSIQFEAAETPVDAAVVENLQEAMGDVGLCGTDPLGETYGADNRHYVAAGIPTVVFGPGTIDQAHYPDETVRWGEVRTATEILTGTVRRFLS
jgi:acetylornithine deacetylase